MATHKALKKGLGMSAGHSTSDVITQKSTLDAFLGGALEVAQPQKGFRAGSDSVLLGAAVRSGTQSIADLGAGVGVAALVGLFWQKSAHATLIERDPQAAQQARENLARNGLEPRARVVEADFLVSGPQRQALGLNPDSFETIVANPPYFDDQGGTAAPEKGRAGARHMPRAALHDWARVATSLAQPEGEVIFVHRASALPELLAAFERRLGAITVWPLSARHGSAPKTVLVRGIKGSRAPFSLLAPLVLHEEQGNGFATPVRDVLMGVSPLVWP